MAFREIARQAVIKTHLDAALAAGFNKFTHQIALTVAEIPESPDIVRFGVLAVPQTPTAGVFLRTSKNGSFEEQVTCE
jgi:hypothetical protein